jgi:hypothetical protein
MKIFGISILVLLGVIALGWFLTANDVLMSGFFSPKYEQVRYNTFKQSQSYNDGMAAQLDKDEIEWANATPENRQMIRGAIVAQFASYNETMLPPNEYAFLQKVRNSP